VLKFLTLIVVAPATLLAMPSTSLPSVGNFATGFSEHTVNAGGRTIYYRIDVSFAKTPLPMPVLAMGGEKSMGALMPEFAKAVAVNVQAIVIPDAGHWLMDENPRATIAALVNFLDSQSSQ
jgi:pimeloyl-ACP methyl ester carboxylesterase